MIGLPSGQSLPTWMTTSLKNGVIDSFIKLAIASYEEIKDHEFKKIPKEDTRRNLLKKSMVHHKREFGIIFNISAENGLYDEETFEDTGRIDICCFLNELEDNYIAFECKRFLKSNTIKSYFNSEYLGEGINRFINNTYSRNMDIGGMIIFLESGNYEKLQRLIFKSLPETSIKDSLQDLSKQFDYNYIYRTSHNRVNNIPIHLTHVLMDFSDHGNKYYKKLKRSNIQ